MYYAHPCVITYSITIFYNTCTVTIAARDGKSNSSGYVKIVDSFVYGKNEKAYHINKTWVCVDKNNRINVFGAAENSRKIVKRYAVSLWVVY